MPYIEEYEEKEHYKGKVTQCGFGESKTGTIYFGVKVRGPHGEVEKKLWMTPAAEQYSLDNLAQFGVSDPFDDATHGILVGQECDFTVEHNAECTHTGIGFLNGPMREMSDGAVRQFGYASGDKKAELIARAKSILRGGLVRQPKAANKPAPTKSEIDDDDLPF